MMNRYVQLEELGNGTYGSVLLGQRVDTGEKVLSSPYNHSIVVKNFCRLGCHQENETEILLLGRSHESSGGEVPEKVVS